MPATLVARHVKPFVVEALAEARAVCLLGARQVGKSTLVREIARHEHPARYVTLDDETESRSAATDPTGYVARLHGPTVIDEIQRAPALLLALKRRLDESDAPGQFLITGSANVLTLPTIADALPGRVDYLRLSPFSQGELSGRREAFVEQLLSGTTPEVEGSEVGAGAYAQRIAIGGFPEAQRRSRRGRRTFFESYVASILGRDLDDVARVRDGESVGRLLAAIASRSAGLFSARGLSRELGADHKTIASHTRILEDLFLVRRLPAWHVNLGNRQIKTPKIHVADSGLLSHLLGASAERIVADGQIAGLLFETFSANELLRQSDWAEGAPAFFHWRDRGGREVDIVIEAPGGEVAGVAVKSSATVTSRDFAGLAHLRDALGERFQAGVVLYTGERTLSFGERLAAVPLCGLWA